MEGLVSLRYPGESDVLNVEEPLIHMKAYSIVRCDKSNEYVRSEPWAGKFLDFATTAANL